jgi:hypothetical protein
MLLNKRENIEDYLMAQQYVINQPYTAVRGRVENIEIKVFSDNRHDALVTVIVDEYVGGEYVGFGYDKLITYSINLSSDVYTAFRREYQIDLALADDVQDCDLYDLYLSKLSKITRPYYRCLREYISTLDVGDFILYRQERHHIHNLNGCKRGSVDIKSIDGRVYKNIPFSKLKPYTEPHTNDDGFSSF